MLSSSILLFTFVKYLNTAFENSSPWIYFVSSKPEFVKSIPKFLTFYTVKTNSWNKVSWKDWCLLILCLCIVTTKISVVRGRLYYSGAGKWWSMGWCSHYWDLNCSSHWNYLILIQLVPSITTHLARYCCWYIWDRIVSLGWDQTGVYWDKLLIELAQTSTSMSHSNYTILMKQMRTEKGFILRRRYQHSI